MSYDLTIEDIDDFIDYMEFEEFVAMYEKPDSEYIMTSDDVEPLQCLIEKENNEIIEIKPQNISVLLEGPQLLSTLSSYTINPFTLCFIDSNFIFNN